MNTRQALITIVAIAAIAAIAICTLNYGVTVPVLTLAIVAIAGLGGYQIHQARSK